MTDPVLRIVAAVVLDDDGYVLVVRKRGTTAFMQPGGKIEPGEQPLAALQREVVEELGTAVEPSSVRSLGRHRAIAANEPGHTVDAYLYLVRLDGTPAVAAEIGEMAWVDPSAPGDVELAPLTRDTVFALARELV
ncbi:NUDIX hydrolase [Mycolicibacterium goodii]|uniref:NUDIX domain-containing protein n=1 Tax=Mycolicibacterium goodii TaxID=134601 RepID=A0ABS6HG70_MYCGD|nr:NUDIX domain-containing protein [Mycolicibacterium goodii]MBU8821657.1 NUDIX domain-containing protein [Mycolicibacterium goodii]MBU8836019.1 NUDIX domain-containing protein [Mycolicibacterium goodii]